MTLVKAVRARPGAGHRLRGRRPGASRGRPVRRLGAAARTSRSSTRPGRRCSTRASPRTRRATALTSCPGAGSRRRRRRSRSWRRTTTGRPRCGRAGTARPRCRRGGCWREPAPDTLAPLQTGAQAGLRDGDLGADRGGRTSRCRRWTPNGNVLATSPMAPPRRTSGSPAGPRSCPATASAVCPRCATTAACVTSR